MGGCSFFTILFLCNFFVCESAETTVISGSEGRITFLGETKTAWQFFETALYTEPKDLQNSFEQACVFGWNKDEAHSFLGSVKNCVNNHFRMSQVQEGNYLFIPNFNGRSVIIIGTQNTEDAFKILKLGKK